MTRSTCWPICPLSSRNLAKSSVEYSQPGIRPGHPSKRINSTPRSLRYYIFEKVVRTLNSARNQISLSTPPFKKCYSHHFFIYPPFALIFCI